MPESPISFFPSILIFSQKFKRGQMPDSSTGAHYNSPYWELELPALMRDTGVAQIWWSSHCYLYISMTHLHRISQSNCRLWQRDGSVCSVDCAGRQM
jgi:hypothetical protein